MPHEVFDRTETESSGTELSAGTYNLVIGLVLLWGFGLNWYMVKTIPVETLLQIRPLFFFGGYFLLCIGGIFLFQKSTSPFLSFIGYNMVAVPFGAVINIVVARYDSQVVLEALQLTGGVTLLMMFLGTLFPVFFSRIAGALTIALLAVILVELANMLFFKKDIPALDWIVAVIFCGYIGYDWGRANQIPKTLDNAVDSAASLYMDIINLFLRILRILGRRR
jgi:FtsH-binding integral membrane protein